MTRIQALSHSDTTFHQRLAPLSRHDVERWVKSRLLRTSALAKAGMQSSKMTKNKLQSICWQANGAGMPD